MNTPVRHDRTSERFPSWAKGAIAVRPSQKVHDEQGLAVVANLKTTKASSRKNKMNSKSTATTMTSIRDILDAPEPIENENLSGHNEEHKTYEVAILGGMLTGTFAAAQHVLEFTESVASL